MKQSFFDAEGHVTDTALLSLQLEEIDMIARLELSEHLSFCDECLDRYTALLTEEVLLAPPQPMQQSVLRRVRSEGRVLQFRRFLTAGVAACFALVFWFSGAFLPPTQAMPAHYSRAYAFSQRLTNHAQELSLQFSERFEQLLQQLSTFDLKGASNDEKK